MDNTQEQSEMVDNAALPLTAVGMLDPKMLKRLHPGRAAGKADRVVVAAFNASL
jgi:hypothetical protein